MSQQQRENMGVFPNGGGKNAIKPKEMKNNAGDFKSGAILPKLPGHEPLDSGGIKEGKFQDLRNSTIRRDSI